MPFLLSCTHCGKTMNAPDNALGKRVRCPFCSQAILVPDAPLAPAVEVAPPPPPVERAKAVTARPPARPLPKPAAPVRRRADDDEDDEEDRRRPAARRRRELGRRPRRDAPALGSWLLAGGAAFAFLVAAAGVVVWALTRTPAPVDTPVAALPPGPKPPAIDQQAEPPPQGLPKEEPPKVDPPRPEPPPDPGPAPVPVDLPKLDLPRPTSPGLAFDTRPLPLAGGTVAATLVNVGGQKLVGDLCWTADGRGFFALDENGVLRRVALAGFREEKRLDLNRRCGWLSVSKRGLVVTLLDLQEAWVIDPNTLAVTQRVAAPAAERVVSSPALTIAVAANSRNGLTVLDLVKGEPVREYPSLRGWHAVVTPDGKYLFFQGGIEQLRRVRIDGQDLQEDESSDRIAQNGQRINVSPDGKYVCLPSGGGNPSIPGAPGTRSYSTYIYRVDDLKKPALTLNSGAYPRVVGFDPKGGRIFAQNHSTPLIVYSSTGIKQKEVNTNGRDRLEPEQFLAHPDGGPLLIRTQNAVVYVDLTGAAPPSAKGPAADPPAKGGAAVRPLFFDTGAYMNRLALSPDGRVVVAALGNQVRRWDAHTGRPLGSPVVHTQEVHGVAFSPDGRLLATGCNDGKARLWDANTGTPRKEFPAQGGHVGRVAFSPDGKILAAHADQAFKLWEVSTGKEVASCEGSRGAGPIFGISNVSFSRDGKLIAAGDQAGTVKVWDTATGALKHTLSGHKREALTVAFSPDGKWLASGSLDQTVKLWAAATFEEAATIPAHRQMIRSVAFSPDGKLLATASQDGTLKLWDVAGRKEVLALPRGGAHYRDPVIAEFSRDGTTLVSAWMDQSVRLWDVQKLLGAPGNP